ncbi:MAG: 4Fe-4S binding protein [Deferribacteraceae bacterium]|jgi:ferredoxin-type protein NapH|nr:4Fe-4S binding protein [Deferribacteraceae bacterium]
MSRVKISRARIWAALGGVAVIITATAANFGIGTYCTVCPLGFLQISAASRGFPVNMLPGVLAVILLILFWGKFFCGWFCPTMLVKKTFRNDKPSGCDEHYAGGGKTARIPHILLGITLVASFIVQFPVFCLICPIGLFFGIIYAVFRLFTLYEPSWNLIIFPFILFLEVVLFRRWCSSVCPLSALFTLIRKIPVHGSIQFTLNKDTCLYFNNRHCQNCERVCPAGIMLTSEKNAMEECIICFECKDKCPADSVKIDMR